MSVERGIWVGRGGAGQEGNRSQRHEVARRGLVAPRSEAWQGLGRHKELGIPTGSKLVRSWGAHWVHLATASPLLPGAPPPPGLLAAAL